MGPAGLDLLTGPPRSPSARGGSRPSGARTPASSPVGGAARPAAAPPVARRGPGAPADGARPGPTARDAGDDVTTPLDELLRAELAVHGLRAAPPLQRRGGAGPSNDGHWLLRQRSAGDQRSGGCGGGARTTLPMAEDSPFALDEEGRLTKDGVVVEDVALEPIDRPAFYDLVTADGVRYEELARLHGDSVLATTVVQTCIRYRDEDTRCRFCTIEESLRAGSTAQVKRPADLAEVARAAVALDGVTQMVMTTGTSTGRDRGAKHLVRCVEAVLAAVPGLPIQVQIEPPLDLEWIDRLHAAGAAAVGIHVESMDEEVRRRWTPGKAEVPIARYEEAWRRAVAVFGPNRVSTYLLVGLGEDPDHLVAQAERLIAMGVYPFVVPYRPMAGSLAFADGVPAPSAGELALVTGRVGRALRHAGMRGAEQVAGCAACGACSAIQDEAA
ncbi:MSMEG_0568 family radical SAM protein [Patulibacter brassicae]|uniref:MSMEG_0568 family radical SAM protein n=1 Tax=Patulibacter brassicae TaxID=1705717 RepID=A0ABU4VSF9_9ACTN|nr:MSMEG_0568 family radical SAM protein [Patulibacter brassicae]MDX8153871.1 MSMEG_0568 family radical SAM protein [Patulibacter brassicae]